MVTFNTSLNPVKDKIFLICLIKDITGISLNEAKEVFNNKDIKEKPFTLSIKRYLDNANRLRDYITCNGIIKIKYHYENNCYHSN